jgi:hypothetical protein
VVEQPPYTPRCLAARVERQLDNSAAVIQLPPCWESCRHRRRAEGLGESPTEGQLEELTRDFKRGEFMDCADRRFAS